MLWTVEIHAARNSCGAAGDGFSGGLPPQRLGGQGQQGAGKGMEKGKSGHDGMVRNASGTFNAHSVNLVHGRMPAVPSWKGGGRGIQRGRDARLTR